MSRVWTSRISTPLRGEGKKRNYPKNHQGPSNGRANDLYYAKDRRGVLGASK